MAPESVSSVHAELGYKPEEAKALRQVRLVWKQLEDLRKKADKDGKYVGAYRTLLEKSLAQVRDAAPAESWEADLKGYWTWYYAELDRLNIYDKEIRRGRPFLEWSEKWLQKEYSVYLLRIKGMCEEPSRRHISEAKLATSMLLKAYVAIIPDD